jgi:hypothetical protein
MAEATFGSTAAPSPSEGQILHLLRDVIRGMPRTVCISMSPHLYNHRPPVAAAVIGSPATLTGSSNMPLVPLLGAIIFWTSNETATLVLGIARAADCDQ